MNSRGFTLIELMIVVAVIGILAAIAIPNFTAQMNKSRRSEGISAMLAVQQAQAKLRANCRWYGENIVNDINTGGGEAACEADAATSRVLIKGASVVTAGTIESDNGYYNIDIIDGTANGNAYTATATAQDRQLGDTDCRVLVLTVNPANPNGVRTSTKVGGGPSDNRCW